MNRKENNKEAAWQEAILHAWQLIEKEKIPATIEGLSALKLQGCAVHCDHAVRISVQWDALAILHKTMREQGASEIVNTKRAASFTFQSLQCKVTIIGYFGTVIRTDPDRLFISIGAARLAVKSFGFFLRTLQKNDPIREAVKLRLKEMQYKDSGINGQAWNHEAYQAWINRFGTPDEAAKKIRRDPEGKLGSMASYFQNVKGKKIINLLGSNGGKALALALMGAQVTIVDIASENAAYAQNVASALRMPVEYIVCDVLQLPLERHSERYDYVFMELGILHYFVDLEPLAALVFHLLKPGGQFIIQEFHPVSTKLVTTKGKRQIVYGNYFDQSLRRQRVAYSKHLQSELRKEEEIQAVSLREWTLGEIITAFAESGLIVQRLDEAPNMKIADIGLPKLFTLVCSK
ncbi:class I SAM-dependent methyltransferase [Sporolactobacillus sp. CPB3-1]|uniref:Class I SAM-dependent methyltransferase n=1 Tax=Sporolactobacillus mangiferae TaxID=2940498 RepID=A0ABT0MA34_9BACL|nr:class I SAM-dependent methyltransferase [Sporolactobacillus mangiferae]MCL1631736.1 class I SAM-dependent methyltransferase [Sporolactobacillus mangiferae]